MFILKKGIIPTGLTVLMLVGSILGLAFSFQVMNTPLTTNSNAQTCGTTGIKITSPTDLSISHASVPNNLSTIKWTSSCADLYELCIDLHADGDTRSCGVGDLSNPLISTAQTSYNYSSSKVGGQYVVNVKAHNATTNKWEKSSDVTFIVRYPMGTPDCYNTCMKIQDRTSGQCQLACNVTVTNTPGANPSPTPTGGGTNPTPTTGSGSTSCSCQVPRSPTDNFCGHYANTQNCPMTQPKGYCDPDGNGDYTDASNPVNGKTGWQRGYEDYKSQCGGGGGSNACFSSMNVNPSSVSASAKFNCSFNYGNGLTGNHLNCAVLKNGQGVSGAGCTYKSRQGSTVNFECTAPSADGTYDVVGYMYPESEQQSPKDVLPASCTVKEVKGTLTVGSGGGGSNPTPTTGTGGGGNNPTPTTGSGGASPTSSQPTPTSGPTATLGPTKAPGSCSAISAPSITLPTNGGVPPGIIKYAWTSVSGARSYSVRVDDVTNGWSGDCNNLNGGDICVDNIPASSPSYEFNGVETHTYHVWIHAINECGDWSKAIDKFVAVPPVHTASTCTVEGYRTLVGPIDQTQSELKGSYYIDPNDPNKSMALWVPDAVKNTQVTVSGITAVSSYQYNPYFIVVPADQTFTVNISTPPGYTVSSTYCVNDITCHASLGTNSTLYQGSSRTITCPSGGYADLYWNFTPTSLTGTPAVTPNPAGQTTATPTSAATPTTCTPVAAIGWKDGDQYTRTVIAYDGTNVVENIALHMKPIVEEDAIVEISSDGGTTWTKSDGASGDDFIVTVLNKNSETISLSIRASNPCGQHSEVLTVTAATVPLPTLSPSVSVTPSVTLPPKNALAPAVIIGGAVLLILIVAAGILGL